VDSLRARRSRQNEFPGEVFDASTTDTSGMLLTKFDTLFFWAKGA
jgi:hypothetical protein